MVCIVKTLLLIFIFLGTLHNMKLSIIKLIELMEKTKTIYKYCTYIVHKKEKNKEEKEGKHFKLSSSDFFLLLQWNYGNYDGGSQGQADGQVLRRDGRAGPRDDWGDGNGNYNLQVNALKSLKGIHASSYILSYILEFYRRYLFSINPCQWQYY